MGRRPVAWWWERAEAGVERQERGVSVSGRETEDMVSDGKEAGGNQIWRGEADVIGSAPIDLFRDLPPSSAWLRSHGEEGHVPSPSFPLENMGSPRGRSCG
ncbi:hypothetical protein E2562_023595 [Oryza meyeriana var. granulata]|uniref:DUF834 domain-containing protein n=1 Tax=Oryza meyeriana var. granulata TaxID=110450 RepID=A0A6G1FBM7_9ORYZ|nr:hypothetical protein E2562_023595 [Oryza meyeriana var. granulata]